MGTSPIYNRLLLPEVGNILLAITLCLFMPIPAAHAEKSSPELVSKIVADHGDQLAGVNSNASAMALFTTTVGPALGLNDAARMLGTKALSAQVAKDLRLTDLSQSAQELMAALAAWQLADAHNRMTDAAASPVVPSPERQDWISGTSRLASSQRLLSIDGGAFRRRSDASSAPPAANGPAPCLSSGGIGGASTSARGLVVTL